MTPRPNFTHKQRPLSAIYIGSLGSNSSANTASPPDLPKLPEPPGSSPGSSSGLPSPPATNSTGSGSVGEESTDKGSSVRQRSSPRPLSTSDMYNGTSTKTRQDMSSTSTLLNDDEQNDENDEDNTARFNNGHRLLMSKTTPNDNMAALQRVRSLTERNRVVLDKLTSISRHGSPVPGSSSRTPFRPTTANTASPSPGAGSSRLSTPSRLSTSRPPPRSTSKLQTTFPSSSNDRAEPGHSGSETERETTRTYSHTHSYSSSDSMSNTPTSSYAPSSDVVRPRRISAPSSPKSPHKNRRPSPGPSRTPRKRASMAVSVSDVRRDESDEEDEDVTKAALAAVASVRRSPGSQSKRNLSRQPLPREFRESGRRSVLDDRPPEPVTPQRERFSHAPRSPSPSKQTTGSVVLPTPSQTTQRSPRRPSAARYSTIRELTRRHQTRWLSEDLSAASTDASVENDTPNRVNGNSTAATGRRQGHRSGSSESPYAERTLLGEGLRAAGLAKQRDSQEPKGDAFTNGRNVFSPREENRVSAISVRRTHSTSAATVANGMGEWDSPSPVTTNGRAGMMNGTRLSSTRASEIRTPGTMRSTSASYVTPIRPNTSMAAFHHETPLASSSRHSTSYRTPREYEATSSMAATLDEPVQLIGTPHAPDRAYTPLFNHTPRSGHGEGHPEHRKLLTDALGMFESQLSRLPPMGHTTTVTIPEVFQNSQTLVQALDRLNDSLRSATTKALDSQIDAEVGDVDAASVNLVDLWSAIGGEHREHLRLTEEIVRTMTLFFLGVGRVLRETTMVPGPQSHMRTMSLDEDAARRVGLNAGSSVTSSERRSGDGRLSRETRRSWEPRSLAETRAIARLASPERATSRPSSSAHVFARSSAASSSEGRSMADGARGKAPTPPTLRNGAPSVGTTSSRRYSPREPQSATEPRTDTAPLMSSLDSQETLRAREPSPTPVSRHGSFTSRDRERIRALPSISIPPSLSTLPSESLLRRTPSALDGTERKKMSTSSNITVRAESSLPPVIKPPNTTTAVTTATVFNDSPIEMGSAISRTSSSGSAHANGVTFSRPSPVSVSTLSGLQQQHESRGPRHRAVASIADAPRSPMSGSETERPRTIASRVRTSLDRPTDGDSKSRASTLTSTRRARSRTVTSVTEIFAHARH